MAHTAARRACEEQGERVVSAKLLSTGRVSNKKQLQSFTKPIGDFMNQVYTPKLKELLLLLLLLLQKKQKSLHKFSLWKRRKKRASTEDKERAKMV